MVDQNLSPTAEPGPRLIVMHIFKAYARSTTNDIDKFMIYIYLYLAKRPEMTDASASVCLILATAQQQTSPPRSRFA